MLTNVSTLTRRCRWVGAFIQVLTYHSGIHAVATARVAVFTNLAPAFAVLLSAGLRREQVQVLMLAGGFVL